MHPFLSPFKLSYKIEDSYKIVFVYKMTDLVIETCPICLEDHTPDSVLLSCRHRFHKKCINTAIFKFKSEHSIDFELKTCPMCRNHLTATDKRMVITGEQFVRAMHNILLSDIENKPELCKTIDNSYDQLTDEHLPETITAEDVYTLTEDFRYYDLEQLEKGYSDDDRHRRIREYNTLLDVCKRNFGFV